MRFLEHVTEQLNMRWAWEKVRTAARPGDVWIDEIELAGFDLELERNLDSIAPSSTMDTQSASASISHRSPKYFPQVPLPQLPDTTFS